MKLNGVLKRLLEIAPLRVTDPMSHKEHLEVLSLAVLTAIAKGELRGKATIIEIAQTIVAAG